MKTVYIQRSTPFFKGGSLHPEEDWLNEPCYSAAQGFRLRGHEVRGFTYDTLPRLELTKENIVFGEVRSVLRALHMVGVSRTPYVDSYPNPLRRYMDRSPSEIFVSDLRTELHQPGFRPVFVKPSREHKLFDGKVIHTMGDFLSLAHLPPRTLIWRVPFVNFLSEFRVFVHNGDIIGVKHYAGDPLVFPDPAVVKKIVIASRSLGHKACGIDVGVAHFPERPELIRTPTLLVEFNDAYSLGSYGLNSCLFAQMIEDRWEQMVGL